MGLKMLIYCLLAISVWTLQLTHTEVEWLNKKLNRWSGPLAECDEQCKKTGGDVCDEFPKSCCQKGACNKKEGILVCSKPQEGFKCEKGKNNGLSYLYTLLPQLKKFAQ